METIAIMPHKVSNGLGFNYDQITAASQILRAINHDLRKSMLLLIDTYGRLTVTELLIKMRLPQSVTSQHLAILRKAGIVIPTRSGKNIYYSLNRTRIADISEFVHHLLGMG